MNTFSVYIGYDPRQPVAFNTLAQSIWRYASRPVSITALDLKTLPIERTGLTEFTYSRFLAPWLSSYEGYSLFVDSDFLCLHDVIELLMYPIAEPECAVYVAKNPTRKFEWPSLMLFDNTRCKILTPKFVDDKLNHLFNFAWAEKVGNLPLEWNHLANYDTPRPDPKMVHFTQGIPVWPETKDSEHVKAWFEAFDHARSTCSFDDLMGHSVHAKPVRERLANG